MDGYTLADWMECRHQGSLDTAMSILETGDGGDKLYAAIYLLVHGVLGISRVNEVIFENCETEETLRAWQAIAKYIDSSETPLFGGNEKSDLSEVRTNVTFYNLLPMVIRKSDKQEAIEAVDSLVATCPVLRDDMREIVMRIKSRWGEDPL